MCSNKYMGNANWTLYFWEGWEGVQGWNDGPERNEKQV